MALNWTDFVWTIKRYLLLYPQEFFPSQTGNSGKYLTTDGTTASWASVAAGAANWTETSIDFGSDVPKYDATFTVVDATVTPASKIAVVPSGTVASGRVGNDWEWDGLILSALPGSGSFTLSATAFPGPVVGRRTVQYQIA